MTYEAPAHVHLFDGVLLRQELTALARAESHPDTRRKAALAVLKARYLAAREWIRTQTESGAFCGMQPARALCGVQDVMVQVLYDFATKHFYYAQNPTESECLAVIAVGGYGRGLLAPFSDVDLLFLRPFKKTAWGECVIELVLGMLWDIGLKVGHAARSLQECVRLAREDVTIRTTLLDARHVWGDATLFHQLGARYREDVARGTEREFVDAKLAEREARHSRQGESRYLVEPNIKDGKGGLRDLQTLYWIGKYLYGVDKPRELAGHGVFTAEEHENFHAAESFLWDVRARLHFFAGRAEERLSFDVQPELAQKFGYDDPNPRRAVEQFMRRYFLVAKDVGDLTRIFCAGLEEQNRKPKPALSRPMPGYVEPRSPGDDLYFEGGRLAARDGAFARDPANLIRIFHVADEQHLDIHPDTLKTITRSLELITEALRSDHTANRLFVTILSSRHDPERALRRMNEAGVLGRFVPAFAHAVGLMQFNMYHHYTVDEHLIRAVGVLAGIERQEMKNDHPLASDLVRRITAREALYCAVFLHDIAKGLEGSHSRIGAGIAQSLCLRWGLSADDTALAVWLVENHLVLSDTAQRRDISDPKTVRDFVALVGSPETLQLLFLLTVADIRAVGPGVWNGWKAQLLGELYHEAAAVLSGPPQRSSRVAAAKASLAERLADWSDDERANALAQHREKYWLAFDADQLERQARLERRAKAGNEPFALCVDTDPARPVCEITIAAPDHPGLFSQLAGAIAASGGSIMEAKAFTADDGWALDVFSVEGPQGASFAGRARVSKLHEAIRLALSGAKPLPPSRLRRVGAHKAAVFAIRPRVRVDNEASVDATVVEVEGADRPGLLAALARAMFEDHLSISSAIVATYGERVMDVFYVRDLFGQKLRHPERIAALQSCLKVVFEGGS